ncbi:MAG TPA: nucleoside 2-deoxyribosyltransferase [Stellaceae bacterium]|nr:nucleoside 2-deoxyribosyltransferase [Stellaceae bacterium]
MTGRPKIYLAGPGVFLPDAIEIGRRKQALCQQHGVEGLYPLDAGAPEVEGAGQRDRLIYRGCIAMIAEADAGIFDLTPFRGISADVGTVFELGMLVGLGKPAFAYSNVAEDYLTRARAAGMVLPEQKGGAWVDAAGMAVEDFGNADNLMLDAGLREGGYPLIRIAVPAEERFRDLRGFEACLDLVKGALLGRSPPRMRTDRR